MKWDRVNQRRAVVWGAWGLVLLAGLSGLLVWHTSRSWNAALRAFAASVGSPEYRDYLPAPVADERNAASAFSTASADLDVGREWTTTPGPEAWTQPTEARARELIAAHRSVLDNLAAAAALPECVWPETTELDTQSMLPLLRAARLLRIEGFFSVADRDSSGAARAFGVLGRLAECLYAAPHLVGSLMAVAVERSRLEVAHAVVASPESSTALLDEVRDELDRLSRVDRVASAIAVEGALALHLIETRPPEGRLRRFLFETFLRKRMSTALALRWTEFAAWSRLPFERLRDEPTPSGEGKRSISGMVADLATANLRHGVFRMRANRELIELALLATEIRLQGLRENGYSGALAQHPELGFLSEGDGSAVLIDRRLEALLRDRLANSGTAADSNLASILELTVWRLPAPRRSR